eukprot:CAMPEP_0119044788 /NCGR_PEP_ID=MMETSP1177-20130426/34640_1 /TAXON_ID=2985 /ORGANISM="Ochromonas sp, Strain CCMP1899" /LENGTH=105 /DNA_ID=CAMNT_0007015479 /DNA_START=32 /DNA_END=346 /DNA_ORIENTATION=+
MSKNVKKVTTIASISTDSVENTWTEVDSVRKEDVRKETFILKDTSVKGGKSGSGLISGSGLSGAVAMNEDSDSDWMSLKHILDTDDMDTDILHDNDEQLEKRFCL